MPRPIRNQAKRKVAASPKTAKIRRRQAPGRSIESRENQLINLAVSLAERQIKEGTASSQVLTHFLKLGSTNELLERQKLEKENQLLEAKTRALQSAQRVEELYAKALSAMRAYSGQVEESEEDD